jgi:alkanesulfonate monooxygenase SsuD/methylene tetrahydromethanopterin reductase-like flavin-dependent oxidoreductase (luciferase family)
VTTLGIVCLPSTPPDRLRAVAEAADDTGVDELWLWEDCFEHGGIATTAAMLAWTERLHVGIGVMPVPLRNPAVTAMEIASLSGMFPGRVHAGLGHGVLDWMDQIGARAESPMTLLAEYVRAVHSLLAGETVTTEGRYVRLRDVTLGRPPSPPPPLHVGAIRPRTLALAGELADGVILTADTTPEQLRDARVVFDAARRPGAAPGRVTVYLRHGSDPEAVAGAVRRTADAGADAVILEPDPGADPVAHARFVGDVVRTRLG